MAYNKSEDSELYTFYPKVKPYCKQFSKAFSEMHADVDDFKKIYLQRKLISKIENEINDLNSALDSLKEEHVSLINENFSTSNILVEKVVCVCVYDVTSLTLKLENENLKEKLTQAMFRSTTSYMSSSERGIGFEKNPRLAIRNRKISSLKAICHHYGDKCHTRPLCRVRNVKVPNGTMA